MPSPDVTNPLTVDAATLRDLLTAGRGLRILDVRTPGEFETAHIPGAYNVPLDLLREHRTELRAHLDDQVVLVCRSGARATQAGQTLAEVGLPNVKVLDGALHIPLHDLPSRIDDVPGGEIWVHCAAGYRATIAASLLAATGRHVVAVDDDFDQARANGLLTLAAN